MIDSHFLHFRGDYNKNVFLNYEDKRIEKKEVLIYFKADGRIIFLFSTCS